MYMEVYEKFYDIPISDTYGLKIRFKNFDLQFALVLRFLHWCYPLIALLSANQNQVIFSCTLLFIIIIIPK